jgi:beta-glucanase (GH16 family)
MKNTLSLFFLIISSGIINAQCKIDYSRYHLILDEQFNTTLSDLATRWNFSNAGGNPLSGYGAEIFDASKISLPGSGGICRITATKLAAPLIVSNPDGTTRTVKYISGMLRSKMIPDAGCWPENQGFTYGIFEMRAQLPQGSETLNDVWPTFWLYTGPTEIDIMDDVNEDTDRRWMSGMINWGKYPNTNAVDWQLISDCNNCGYPEFNCEADYAPNQYIKYANKVYRSINYTKNLCCNMGAYKGGATGLSNSFNTYTVAWTPDKVTFFFNGREVYTVNPNVIETYQCAADIRASLQMRETANMNETYMNIDYIRVWKPNNNDYSTSPFKTAQGWVNDFFAANLVQNPPPPRYMSSGFYNCIALNHTNEDEIFFIGTDQKIVRRLGTGNVETVISGIETTTSGISFNSKYGLVTYRDINGTLKFINAWSDGTFHTNFFNAVGAGANDLKVLNGPNCVVHSKYGDIFYVGTDNKIHRLRLTSGVWYHQLIGSYSNPSNITTGELALDENDNNANLTIYYRGLDNRLQCQWFNGNTGAYENTYIDANWGTSAYLINSNKQGVLKCVAGKILYIGTDEKLHQFYFGNNTWNHELINYTYGSGELLKGSLEWDNTHNILYYMGTDNRIQSLNQKLSFINGQFVYVWVHNFVNDYVDANEYLGFGASGNQSSILQSKWTNNEIIYNSSQSILRFFQYRACEFPADCFGSKNLNRPAPPSDNKVTRKIPPYTIDQIAKIPQGDIKPNEYKIGPNPVENLLKIESDNAGINADISIIDFRGSTLFEKQFQQSKDIVLDFSGYTPGLYLVRIRDKFNITTYKISKK